MNSVVCFLLSATIAGAWAKELSPLVIPAPECTHLHHPTKGLIRWNEGEELRSKRSVSFDPETGRQIIDNRPSFVICNEKGQIIGMTG